MIVAHFNAPSCIRMNEGYPSWLKLGGRMDEPLNLRRQSTPIPPMDHRSVYAIAVSEGQALQIEMNLTEAGFSNEEISALIPDKDTVSPRERTGSVFDGALALLAGIGELVIPGVGRLIAVGPLLATLSAVAAGAAGLGGALVRVGIPESAARHYENRMAQGHILISVHADSVEQVQKARRVLESAAAEDISITGPSGIS